MSLTESNATMETDAQKVISDSECRSAAWRALWLRLLRKERKEPRQRKKAGNEQKQMKNPAPKFECESEQH